MACPITGKQQHATRDEAEAHQKKLVWKNHACGQDERSKGLNVYPCPHPCCGAWHVGHSEGPKMPLVYHYTTVDRLDDILEAGELRLFDPKAIRLAINEPNPLLWFSWNPVWEHSVIKDRREHRQHPPTGRAVTELFGDGLIRFPAPASVAKKRWNDYLTLNKTPVVQREYMAQRGNPVDWLCTDQPVSLQACRNPEVWFRGAWVEGLLVPDADWDAYIDGREDVYAAAWYRLATKILTIADKGEEATLNLTDEAEEILFDDWRVSCRLKEWTQEHRNELRKLAASLSPRPKQWTHGGKKKKKRKGRRKR